MENSRQPFQSDQTQPLFFELTISNNNQNDSGVDIENDKNNDKGNIDNDDDDDDDDDGGDDDDDDAILYLHKLTETLIF